MSLETQITNLATAIGTDIKNINTTIAGLSGGGIPNFIQQTDPNLGTLYIWYKTDALGNVIDILKGP